MTKTILKKALIIALIAALSMPLIIPASAVRQGFSNFTRFAVYTSGLFHDVNTGDWFESYVADAVDFGFIRGRGDNIFDPSGQLTRGETAALAARLRSIYFNGFADFTPSEPFYLVYAEYAQAHGILDSIGDLTAPVTRFEFALMMYRALPNDSFAVINEIPPFGILDVSYGTPTEKAVYSLYRAGILTGSDRYGTFFGGSGITRAEAAAVMVRLAAPSARVFVRLPQYIPASEIFARNMDATFMIETFDSRGNSIRTGSGFFISPDGLALTAQHVLIDAETASVTLQNGDVYPVLGIRATDGVINLALLEIASGKSARSYLTLGDSNLIEAGNPAFAIGSPGGLLNSISEGIIAHANREIDVESAIQFTAPTSFGSGGGPLLNALGQVVGVVSGSFALGQNVNLAIPINLLGELEHSGLISISDYWLSYFADAD